MRANLEELHDEILASGRRAGLYLRVGSTAGYDQDYSYAQSLLKRFSNIDVVAYLDKWDETVEVFKEADYA